MTESEEDRAKRFIDKLEKHIEKASEHKKYSVDRFDILLITISTTALVFSIGFVKDFVKSNTNVDYRLLKTSWLFFTLTIIINLLSQVTGYYANDTDISVTRNIIQHKRGKDLAQNQPKLLKYCNILNITTQILNGLSLLFLLVAIITQISFFSKNL
jgi:hypothetical protein